MFEGLNLCSELREFETMVRDWELEVGIVGEWGMRVDGLKKR